MRLLIYFLVILNLGLLVVNWDSFSSVANGDQRPSLLAREPLVLQDEIGSANIPNQPPSLTDLDPNETILPPTNVISGILSDIIRIVGDIWLNLRDIFTDRPQSLPGDDESPTEDPSQNTRPETNIPSTPNNRQANRPSQTNTPDEIDDLCYRINGYASASEALLDRSRLSTYGIDASVEEVAAQRSSSYRILVQARTSLDEAEQLSQMMSAAAVPNTITENPPLGYLLITGTYGSRSQAETINNRLRRMGFSTRIDENGAAPVRGEQGYFLLVNADDDINLDTNRYRRVLKRGARIASPSPC